MTLNAGQAARIGAPELPAEAVEQLQVRPRKGSLPTAAIPPDPLIVPLLRTGQRLWHDLHITDHEEFGDGIMSAVDFNMDSRREPDPKGDRVRIVTRGKAGAGSVGDWITLAARRVEIGQGTG